MKEIRPANWIAKVWKEDTLLCSKCGGKMRIISFITDQVVIDKILLTHRLELLRSTISSPLSSSTPALQLTAYLKRGGFSVNCVTSRGESGEV